MSNRIVAGLRQLWQWATAGARWLWQQARIYVWPRDPLEFLCGPAWMTCPGCQPLLAQAARGEGLAVIKRSGHLKGCPGPDATPHRKRNNVGVVRDVLRLLQPGPPMVYTPTDLAGALCQSLPTVWHALQYARRQGWVVRDEDGRWSLTEAGQQRAASNRVRAPRKRQAERSEAAG